MKRSNQTLVLLFFILSWRFDLCSVEQISHFPEPIVISKVIFQSVILSDINNLVPIEIKVSQKNSKKVCSVLSPPIVISKIVDEPVVLTDLNNTIPVNQAVQKIDKEYEKVIEYIEPVVFGRSVLITRVNSAPTLIIDINMHNQNLKNVSDSVRVLGKNIAIMSTFISYSYTSIQIVGLAYVFGHAVYAMFNYVYSSTINFAVNIWNMLNKLYHYNIYTTMSEDTSREEVVYKKVRRSGRRTGTKRWKAREIVNTVSVNVHENMQRNYSYNIHDTMYQYLISGIVNIGSGAYTAYDYALSGIWQIGEGAYFVSHSMVQFVEYVITRIITILRTLFANISLSYPEVSYSVSSQKVTAKYHDLVESRSRSMEVRQDVPMSAARNLVIESQALLEKNLVQLKWRADFGETGLQKIINLLNIELLIIRFLIKDMNKSMLQEAVEDRKQVMQVSSPSVIRAYDMILDVATQDATVRSGLYHDKKDKKLFLWKVKDKLEQYLAKIKNMQYEISVARSWK